MIKDGTVTLYATPNPFLPNEICLNKVTIKQNLAGIKIKGGTLIRYHSFQDVFFNKL